MVVRSELGISYYMCCREPDASYSRFFHSNRVEVSEYGSYSLDICRFSYIPTAQFVQVSFKIFSMKEKENNKLNFTTAKDRKSRDASYFSNIRIGTPATAGS
jgi:hypothetical protein